MGSSVPIQEYVYTSAQQQWTRMNILQNVILLGSLLLYINVFCAEATSEQLKQWIVANKKNLPSGAQEAFQTASESDIASTILKIFGFGSSSPSTTTSPPTTTTTYRGMKLSERNVCPFDADPLIISGEYAYCKPSNVGDCPIGFVCDQSFVLGRSICCQDLRTQPSVSSGPVYQWNTVTPTKRPSKWSPFTVQPTRRTPWYIKDRTTWNYDRFTPKPAVTSEFTQNSTILTSTFVPPTTSVPKSVNPWAQLWTTTAAPKNNVNISVLQPGSFTQLKNGQTESVGAITLINDNGKHIIVDTGSSSDTERLLQGLLKESISLDNINAVVITHGHPGHMGNINFFSQKPILFHSMEYIGRHVSQTELKERPYRKLSANIEVWKTPGHTQHDLSVLVHNVNGYGSLAVVGDLIPDERIITDKVDIMADEGVWDSAIKRQNANLMICMADWIIPGHGQPFRVLPHYRTQAGCTRLLSQRHLKAN
uniref:Lactamase_B domain-containing protein n=1 Tax=Steinernema glaseri TaxID=37863 RepID=A0A1I8ATG8_9BILA